MQCGSSMQCLPDFATINGAGPLTSLVSANATLPLPIRYRATTGIVRTNLDFIGCLSKTGRARWTHNDGYVRLHLSRKADAFPERTFVNDRHAADILPPSRRPEDRCENVARRSNCPRAAACDPAGLTEFQERHAIVALPVSAQRPFRFGQDQEGEAVVRALRPRAGVFARPAH